MNTAISIRTDLAVKNAAQEIAQSVGISLSALINSYLRQVIATRRIELYAPEPMTPKLESLIAEVEAELQSGKVSRKFTDVDDFLVDLKK
ncbi:MAG: DUF6364 family protein [Patescibacteria group bacterium]